MANALLFYRTENTTQGDEANPTNLPTAQKLEFTFPDNILEGINETYKNNIRQIPVPNQDGVRKLNLQENGLEISTISINGVFNKNSDGVTKLKEMRKRKQVDIDLQFGVFGISIDNAPEFSLDPDNTRGYHIQEVTIGYEGIRTTRYDFRVTLGFGGTV